MSSDRLLAAGKRWSEWQISGLTSFCWTSYCPISMDLMWLND